MSREPTPILKGVQLWFPKLDPLRPSAKFNPANPTWELQIRTTDEAVMQQWKSYGFKPKVEVVSKTEIFWRVNLKKRSVKQDGLTKADPVNVVDGHRKPLDPRRIGNGSIGNVRVFAYDYADPKNGGQPAVGFTLMGVQVTRLIVYDAVKRQDFDEEAYTEESAADAPEAEGDY